MARGKFERRRKKNYGAIVLLWIVIIAVAIGVGFALGSRNKEENDPNPSVSQTVDQQLPQDTGDATDEDTDQTDDIVPQDTTEETVEETTEETIEETIEETTEVTAPDEIPPEDLSVGESVAALARTLLGKPYKLGGTGPDSFDTTGFVTYCFKQNGITAPRRTAQMAEFGTAVAMEDLQPGDVVIFSFDAESGKPQYPGIYVGDGKFIAARNESYPVSELSMTSSYFAKRFVCARRFG